MERNVYADKAFMDKIPECTATGFTMSLKPVPHLKFHENTIACWVGKTAFIASWEVLCKTFEKDPLFQEMRSTICNIEDDLETASIPYTTVNTDNINLEEMTFLANTQGI